MLLTNGNTVVCDYDYDAYGKEKGGSSADLNPFRYSGEYFDSETGFIYLRNRYYDPSSARFISEDPIRDGYNWYAYCEGNPIKYADPSGLVMTCSETDSTTIISLLTELSGGSLKFEYYNGQICITETYDTKNHVGQTLVIDLINAEETVNVNIGGDEFINDDGTVSSTSWMMFNASGDEPIQIYIDPNDTLGLGTRGTYVQQSDGSVVSEDIPNFVHFGHELIHAWRDINGFFVNSWEEVGLIQYDAPRLWREEELQTMGINYTVGGVSSYNYNSYNGIISENGLRLENGLNTRVSYYYSN